MQLVLSPTESRHSELVKILHDVRNAKKAYREQGADEILRRPELLGCLIDATFFDDRELSVRAAWVLELCCLEEPRLIIPHLQNFTLRLHELKDESALRPAAKICALLSRLYAEEPWEPFDPDSEWIGALVSSGFEWLTGPHKVATQVFAMDTLYHWGLRFDWIHGELLSILDQAYGGGSPGYRSRARKIMDKICQKPRMKRQN